MQSKTRAATSTVSLISGESKEHKYRPHSMYSCVSNVIVRPSQQYSVKVKQQEGQR